MTSRARYIADELQVIDADVYSAGLAGTAGKPAPIFRVNKQGPPEADLWAVVLYEKDPVVLRALVLTHPALRGINFRKIDRKSPAGHDVQIWIETRA